MINYVKLHSNCRGTNKSPNKLNVVEIKLTWWFVDKWRKPFVRWKPHQVKLRLPLPRIYQSIIKRLQVQGILPLPWPIPKYQSTVELSLQYRIELDFLVVFFPLMHKSLICDQLLCPDLLKISLIYVWGCKKRNPKQIHQLGPNFRSGILKS